MPGNLCSKKIEIPPRKRPSQMAYSGVVTGDQLFLKMVIRDKIKPAIAPPKTKDIGGRAFWFAIRSPVV